MTAARDPHAAPASRPFTVLMSVYDRERPAYLEESLASLAASDIPVPELVLVEDGPLCPELLSVIERHRAALNIVSHRLPVNGGLPAALNAGLQVCSHELVARFDSDDLIVPERFRVQLDFLEAHPDVAIVGSWVEEFDAATGAPLGVRALPVDSDALHRFAKLRSPMNHPSVMYRRSTILAAGGYSDIPWMEDYALWVKCLSRGARIANLRAPLVHMRSGVDQMGRRRGWNYIRSELRFAAEFRREGFFSAWEQARFLGLRLLPRLLPAGLLLKVYGRIRRRPH